MNQVTAADEVFIILLGKDGSPEGNDPSLEHS